MIQDDLFHAVHKFTEVTKGFNAAALEKPWAWRSYDGEGLRKEVLRIIEDRVGEIESLL